MVVFSAVIQSYRLLAQVTFTERYFVTITQAGTLLSGYRLQ